MPAFEMLRHRSNDQDVVLIAFDLLELDGDDLRREPLEVRKETLASLLRGSPRECSLTSISRIPATSCSGMSARWGLRASCRSGWARATAPAPPATGSSSRIRMRRRCGGRRRRTGERGGVHEERPRRRSCWAITRSGFSTRALRQCLPDIGLRNSKLPCDCGRFDACFEGGTYCIQLASGQ